MKDYNRFLIDGELNLIELKTLDNRTYILDLHPDERLGLKKYVFHEKGNTDYWRANTFEGGEIRKKSDELPALGESMCYKHLMSQIDGVDAKKQVTAPVTDMRCLTFKEKNNASTDLSEVYSGIMRHIISEGQKRP